jgi:hypothetical protein
MLRWSRTLRFGHVVDHLLGERHGRVPDPRAQESRSMIRPTALPTTASEDDDHSMRVVEYALALVAVVAAGILAFLR